MTYTDQQATDEAVLLLTRKLQRMYPDAYADLVGQLPDGARNALNLADVRADHLRHDDRQAGVTRNYTDLWADDENC